MSGRTAKRAPQLAFYGIYCILGVYCMLIDFGAFRGRFSAEPFVYYTSLSNMVCIGFTLLCFLHQLLHSKEPRDFAPRLKYALVVMILITAIVYNLLLSKYTSLAAYFTPTKNGLYHLLLPVGFFLDWLIFYGHGRIKARDPLLAVGIPLLYVIYILLRAAIVRTNGIYARTLYPYFFMNIDTLGWEGFLLWMGILLAGVLALGYGLYAIDRLILKVTRRKNKASA